MQNILICIYLVTVATAAKLPANFMKCNPKRSDFDQCLPKAVESAIRQLYQVYDELNLTVTEPLDVAALTIDAGSGPMGTKQVYKNLKTAGLEEITCSKAGFDFDKKRLSLQCLIPRYELTFDYELSGKILVLPITGRGPGLIILHDYKLGLVFDLKEYEKKGRRYYQVVGHKLDIDPKLIEVKLDNLFDGDKALGDGMNQVMNENWKELFEDVKASYSEAFGSIFASIFNRLLAKVPISELFGDN
ncbi:protein takeout-like [Zophobas morio]|uniref:protein takeout-like n=1 Tax=Zophobas morio TaxID=2755281 RepID=UPI003083748A